jgi:hypothetical protein
MGETSDVAVVGVTLLGVEGLSAELLEGGRVSVKINCEVEGEYGGGLWLVPELLGGLSELLGGLGNSTTVAVESCICAVSVVVPGVSGPLLLPAEENGGSEGRLSATDVDDVVLLKELEEDGGSDGRLSATDVDDVVLLEELEENGGSDGSLEATDVDDVVLLEGLEEDGGSNGSLKAADVDDVVLLEELERIELVMTNVGLCELARV